MKNPVKYTDENGNTVEYGNNEIMSDTVDKAIDDLFVISHDMFETKSGDITPDQVMRLDKIKKDLLDLILEQTKQNL